MNELLQCLYLLCCDVYYMHISLLVDTFVYMRDQPTFNLCESVQQTYMYYKVCTVALYIECTYSISFFHSDEDRRNDTACTCSNGSMYYKNAPITKVTLHWQNTGLSFLCSITLNLKVCTQYHLKTYYDSVHVYFAKCVVLSYFQVFHHKYSTQTLEICLRFVCYWSNK